MNLFRIAFPASATGRLERSGYSDRCIEDAGAREGFIFSLFGENMPLFTIPCDDTLPPLGDTDTDTICAANDRSCLWAAPESTPRDRHLQLVERIVSRLSEMKALSGIEGKIIATRVEVASTTRTPSAIYRVLTQAYPDATVFLFSTPRTGTWIGASPELLLSAASGLLSTVALAGTREATPAGCTPAAWDDKNRIEQQIVTDFITDSLRAAGLHPEAGHPYTRRAGRVEHICTEISAPFSSPGQESHSSDISPLIQLLSPTPALSGYPRHEAVEFITGHESTPRYCYGGTVGYIAPGDTRIYVNLRSGRFFDSGRRIALYAGGGITRHSIPSDEWEETCRKLTTLLPHI